MAIGRQWIETDAPGCVGNATQGSAAAAAAAAPRALAIQQRDRCQGTESISPLLLDKGTLHTYPAAYHLSSSSSASSDGSAAVPSRALREASSEQTELRIADHHLLSLLASRHASPRCSTCTPTLTRIRRQVRIWHSPLCGSDFICHWPMDRNRSRPRRGRRKE